MRTTFQELVDALGAAKGVKYTTHYLPVEEARAKEELAKKDGDELREMMWSIRPLVASGYGVADGAPGSAWTMSFLTSSLRLWRRL